MQTTVACGKPLVPNRSPCVPADQCSACHTAEQSRERLIADAPDEGQCIWFAAAEKGDVVPLLMLDLHCSHLGLLERLAAALLRQDPPVELSEHVDATLTKLEQRPCLVRHGQHIQLLAKGKVLGGWGFARTSG